MNGGAVGLVIGRLEHQRNAQALADFYIGPRYVNCELLTLKDIDSTYQNQWTIISKGKISNLDLL